MITNQSERKRSIDLTYNDSTVTNSEALKISLSEQLKNVKCQKQEEFYQFKSKQPTDSNMNESISKQKTSRPLSKWKNCHSWRFDH